MKAIIYAVACLASGVGFAACQNVYDVMSHQWIFVCKEAPSPGPNPKCHHEYDVMNHVWVLVCH